MSGTTLGLDTDQIIKHFKANKINATVIDNLEDEIQLELVTNVAHYIISIVYYGDYIELTGSIRGFNHSELMMNIETLLENDDLGYWTASVDLDSSAEDIVDEIVNAIDDKATANLAKDLNKFISYVEKLKRSYADSNIEIGDLLHEITHHYTEN